VKYGRGFFSLAAIFVFTTSFLAAPRSHASLTTSQKIKLGTDKVLAMSPLPDDVGESGIPTFQEVFAEICTDEPSTVFMDAFKKIQQASFGFQYFKLRKCQSHYINGDLTRKIIYINNDLEQLLLKVVPANEQADTFAAILGHEIGHYIYEASRLYTPEKQSPLGNKDSWFDENVPSTQHAFIHGEIDGIGMYLASRAGYKEAWGPLALSYVELAINSDPATKKTVRAEGREERLSIMADYLNGI
jgi:hypothetical protein